MRFSEQDFDIMLQEVFSKPASFEMLCRITRTELEPTVKKLVNNSYYLRNFYTADDLMQDICVQVIKKSVTNFLLKDGPAGKINRDPSGFCGWLHTVAKNKAIDRINEIKYRLGNENTDGVTEGLVADIRSGKKVPESTKEALCKAFDIIITSVNISIYKTLTWLAQALFFLTYDIRRIDANSMLITEFEKKTLFEMYDWVVRNSRYLPWLAFTNEHKNILIKALNETYDENRVYGEVSYYEFFMLKGGKASISDWINRIDSKIRRHLSKDETSDI